MLEIVEDFVDEELVPLEVLDEVVVVLGVLRTVELLVVLFVVTAPFFDVCTR